jgi:WD40 repeat protein
LVVAIWRPMQDLKHSGLAVIYETTGWTEVKRHRHLDPIGILSVAFSPDGTHLAAACDFDVVVADVRTGNVVWRDKRQSLVTAVEFLRDGSVVAGDADGAIALYHGTTGSLLRNLPGHAGRVTGLALSGNGQRLASTGLDGAFHVWNVSNWKELRQPHEHPGGVYAIALDAEGRLVISGGTEGSVRVWDMEADRIVRTFSAHRDTIHAIALSPDRRTMGTAGRDRTIRLWDLTTIVKGLGSK